MFEAIPFGIGLLLLLACPVNVRSQVIDRLSWVGKRSPAFALKQKELPKLSDFDGNSIHTRWLLV